MLQPSLDVPCSAKLKCHSAASEAAWAGAAETSLSQRRRPRRAGAPMTAREIAEALIAGNAPQATRKQAIDLQAAILAALRKRNGATVVGEGATARWALRASPSD